MTTDSIDHIPDTASSKTCTQCHECYPATTEFFCRDKQQSSGLKPHCKRCNSAHARAYYSTHRQQCRAKGAEYAKTHREQRKQYDASRRTEKNRSLVIWFAKNPDKKKLYDRRYRAKYPDKVRANRKRAKHKRRVQSLADTKPISAFDEKAQLKRQKSKCYYCKCKLEKYHIEHIVPISRGGGNDPDNLVLACPFCNQSKNNKLPHEWSKGNHLL